MLENGTLLQDRFLIGERIGVGGMGAVYLATDQKFGSKVAVKETAFDNAELVQAFEREARLLNTLHHPVLPHVSDFFTEGGTQLLVMEYIEGEDLSVVLKRGDRLEIDDIVRWTFELLDALDYLHSHEPPIVHRDIKPSNLKLTPRGNIVLLDFGLAKETSGTTAEMRSVFGYSRRYSPLEQIEGTGTDPRSDIFSLAATIFHLLTGEAPPDAVARASAIVAGRPDPLKRASDLNPEVPVEFASILYSALSLNAADRFVSAPAMRTAIESAFGPGAEAAVPRELLNAEMAEPRLPAEVTPEFVPTEPAVDVAAEEKAIPILPGPPLVSSGETITYAGTLEPSYLPYTSAAWFKPGLAAAILVVLSTLGFGIYNALPEAQPTAEAAPSQAAPEDRPIGGPKNRDDATVQPDAPRAESVSPRRQDPVKNKPAESNTSEVADSGRDEPAVNAPRADRARVTRPQRQRQEEDGEVDDEPVSTIETIFTGQPARDQRPADIPDEERLQRKRDRQTKKRDRPIRPF